MTRKECPKNVEPSEDGIVLMILCGNDDVRNSSLIFSEKLILYGNHHESRSKNKRRDGIR